jgi:hypothetical protein
MSAYQFDRFIYYGDAHVEATRSVAAAAAAGAAGLAECSEGRGVGWQSKDQIFFMILT